MRRQAAAVEPHQTRAAAVASAIFGGCKALVFSDLILRSLMSTCFAVRDAVFGAVVFSAVMATLPCLLGPKPGESPNAGLKRQGGRH
jgi:hypothetical protein